MKKFFTIIIFLIIFTLPKLGLSTLISSNGTGGGDWNSAASWNPAAIPGCYDTIAILPGDSIHVRAQVDLEACPPIVLIIAGVLNFPDNGPKLKLPCDSYINGLPGGWISAPGDDNSNKISICSIWIWESKEADLPGPFEFGIAPLPITLISFKAEIDNTSIKLVWKTAAELNNDFFTVERSQNGINFVNIADIPGSGNSSVVQDYEQYDDSPLIGTAYYRLKQTDFDGQYEYVGLLAVNFNQNDEGICTLHVYPNPCVGSCTIDLKDCPLAYDQVDIELYDALGKKIVNRIAPTSKSQDISFHLNASNNLAPGVYIIRASTNGKNQSSRVVVK